MLRAEINDNYKLFKEGADEGEYTLFPFYNSLIRQKVQAPIFLLVFLVSFWGSTLYPKNINHFFFWDKFAKNTIGADSTAPNIFFTPHLFNIPGIRV